MALRVCQNPLDDLVVTTATGKAGCGRKRVAAHAGTDRALPLTPSIAPVMLLGEWDLPVGPKAPKTGEREI